MRHSEVRQTSHTERASLCRRASDLSRGTCVRNTTNMRMHLYVELHSGTT